MVFALLKTVLSLVAVLGLMVLVVVALRKFLNVGPAGNANIVDIDILGQKSIHPKRALYVVRVLNKVLILSLTEHGIDSLGEIDDESVINTLNVKQELLREQKSSRFAGLKHRLEHAQSMGEFFHKPFNVVLWRAVKTGTRPPVTESSEVHV